MDEGKIKGTQVLGVVKALRSMRHLAEPLLPQALDHYLEDRINPGVWYPDRDYAMLTLVLGQVLAPQMDGDVWHRIGRIGAQRDFQGIYSALVRHGDPAWTVRRLPDSWRLFRDVGEVVITEVAGSSAEALVRGYPSMCPELAKVSAGYFEGALRESGVVDAEVRAHSVTADSARFSFHWSAP